jgi:hypothetical protein
MLCAAARSMLNHAISKWDKTITPELWPFVIQHATTDLKVIIQWFKREGDEAMPKNKHGFLLQYCETCTCVVASVTYHDDEEAIATVDIHVAVDPVGDVVAASTVAPVGGATATTTAAAVDVGVATSAVALTDILWSITRPPAVAAAQPPVAAAW